MSFLGIIFALLCCSPALLLSIDLIYYIIARRHLFSNLVSSILAFLALLLLPLLYLVSFDPATNDCCGDSATFSPGYKPTIYIWIIILIANYFYARYKKNIVSPIIEVLSNCLLLGGFVFNFYIFLQVREAYFVLIGNLPIAILFAYQLIDNYQKYISLNKKNDLENISKTEKWLWKLLTASPFVQYPILLIICIPILIFITCVLLLFGQKPDSIVRAFTDTYKHGFSQLDYQCANVECGGHFLCSVAANGHKNTVKPIRYGERAGGKIVCNRQLLIANAFEEIIETKLPRLHTVIRRNYNKIGDLIHKHYYLFNNKKLADAIYFFMKPLEWIFLLVIYTVDKKPENLIARQYIAPKDKAYLQNK